MGSLTDRLGAYSINGGRSGANSPRGSWAGTSLLLENSAFLWSPGSNSGRPNSTLVCPGSVEYRSANGAEHCNTNRRPPGRCIWRLVLCGDLPSIGLTVGCPAPGSCPKLWRGVHLRSRRKHYRRYKQQSGSDGTPRCIATHADRYSDGCRDNCTRGRAEKPCFGASAVAANAIAIRTTWRCKCDPAKRYNNHRHPS